MRRAGTPREPESGFTLIELMVVVLILGVLMAIAIPTFLNLTSGASTTAVESTMTNLLTTENRAYVTGSSYLSTGPDLQALEPNLPMGNPALTAKNVVYAAAPPTPTGWSGFDNRSVAMSGSDGTKCWYIYQGAAPESSGTVPAGTYYATGGPDSTGYCSTAVPPTAGPTPGNAARGTPLRWYTSF